MKIIMCYVPSIVNGTKITDAILKRVAERIAETGIVSEITIFDEESTKNSLNNYREKTKKSLLNNIEFINSVKTSENLPELIAIFKKFHLNGKKDKERLFLYLIKNNVIKRELISQLIDASLDIQINLNKLKYKWIIDATNNWYYGTK